MDYNFNEEIMKYLKSKLLKELFLIYKKNNDLFTLSFLFLLAFSLRIAFLKTRPLDLWSDDAVYLTMARYIKELNFDKVFHPHWRLLYPFFTALFYPLTKDWVYSARLTSVIFGSLLIFPIYFLTKEIWGKLKAFLTCVLIVFSTALLNASTSSLAESTFLFILWIGIYYFIKSIKYKTLKTAFLSGLFFGLSYLTKSEGIAIFVGLFFTLLLSILIIIKKPINFKIFKKEFFNLFKMYLLISIGFFLIISPYRSILKSKYPELNIFSKIVAHFNLSSPYGFIENKTSTWAQDIWSLDSVDMNSDIYKGNSKFFEKNKILSIFSDTLKRIKSLLIFHYRSYFGWPILSIIAIGLIFSFFKYKHKGVYIFVFLFFMFLAVMFFAPSANERYLYIFRPYTAILLSIGSIGILEKLFRLNKIFFIIITIAIVYLISREYLVNIRYYWSLPYVAEVLGEGTVADKWLSENDPGKKVMLRHEGNAFFSRSYIVYSPQVINFDELIEYAKIWNVDYIVASSNEISNNVDFLYKNPKNYPSLKLIKNFNVPVSIYKFTR